MADQIRDADILVSALAAALVAAGREGVRGTGAGAVGARPVAACLAALQRRIDGGDLAMLPQTLREAQLDALQLCLDVFAAGLPDPGSGTQTAAAQAAHVFLAAARAFCDHQRQIVRARGATWRPEPWLVALQGAEDARRDGGLASILTVDDVRRRAEHALLSELDLAVGCGPIPDGFLRIALATDGAATGWCDAFALYAFATLTATTDLRDTIAAAGAPLAQTNAAQLTAAGRDIAMRFEVRFSQIQASIHSDASSEVAAYVERMPRDVAALAGVNEAAVRRIARRLADGGVGAGALEAKVAEFVALLRLAPAFALGPGLAELANLRGEVTRHIAAGRFEVALSLVESALAADREQPAAATAVTSASVVAAELAWAVGLCQVLRGDFDRGRDSLEIAIATLGPLSARTTRRYRLTLAHAHALTGGPASVMAATEIYGSLVCEEAPGEAASLLVPAALGLGATVGRLARPQRHIRWPTLAAQVLRRFAESAVPVLPARLRAELWFTFAEICGMLTQLGAERRDEMREALRSAVSLAREAHDVRLESLAHVRLAESQPAGEAATDERSARNGLVAALSAAQLPGLRLRDPITWALVKLRIGEALTGRGSDAGDGSALPAGIIALKAALRILPAAHDTVAGCRAATALGEAFLRLARLDRRELWRQHGLAAFALGLDGLTAEGTPLLFADTHMRMANALAGPDPQTQDIAALEAAVAHYQTAVLALQPSTNRWAQARRALADIVIAIGRRRFDLDRLEDGAAIHRGTLSATTEADLPNIHAQCWIGVATAQREMARLTDTPSLIDDALRELVRQEAIVAERGPAWLLAATRAAVRETREALNRYAVATRGPQRAQPPPLPQSRDGIAEAG